MTHTVSPESPPLATAPPHQEQERQPRPRPEERLCEHLIALIEQGVNPWRKPWQPSRCGQHRNLLTGRAYTGGNPALLELQLGLRGSDLPLWIGHQQAAQQGWHPRKGSHACLIYRPVLLQPTSHADAAEAQTQPDAAKEPQGKGAANTAPSRTLACFRPALVFNAADLQTHLPPAGHPTTNRLPSRSAPRSRPAAPSRCPHG